MWEIRIKRVAEQRAANGRRRTVGRYSIWRDGEQVKGKLYSGMVAECRGPGDNTKKGSEFDLRIAAGTYPLATQAGSKYVTIGYKDSLSPKVYPKPGVEVLETGYRSEILIHPGIGFLASVGCINLCTSLPNADERIDYVGSRNRVIAMIEDMKDYLDNDWPKKNGKRLTGAIVVIEDERNPEVNVPHFVGFLILFFAVGVGGIWLATSRDRDGLPLGALPWIALIAAIMAALAATQTA